MDILRSFGHKNLSRKLKFGKIRQIFSFPEPCLAWKSKHAQIYNKEMLVFGFTNVCTQKCSQHGFHILLCQSL